MTHEEEIKMVIAAGFRRENSNHTSNRQYFISRSPSMIILRRTLAARTWHDVPAERPAELIEDLASFLVKQKLLGRLP